MEEKKHSETREKGHLLTKKTKERVKKGTSKKGSAKEGFGKRKKVLKARSLRRAFKSRHRRHTKRKDLGSLPGEKKENSRQWNLNRPGRGGPPHTVRQVGKKKRSEFVNYSRERKIPAWKVLQSFQEKQKKRQKRGEVSEERFPDERINRNAHRGKGEKTSPK